MPEERYTAVDRDAGITAASSEADRIRARMAAAAKAFETALQTGSYEDVQIFGKLAHTFGQYARIHAIDLWRPEKD